MIVPVVWSTCRIFHCHRLLNPHGRIFYWVWNSARSSPFGHLLTRKLIDWFLIHNMLLLIGCWVLNPKIALGTAVLRAETLAEWRLLMELDGMGKTRVGSSTMWGIVWLACHVHYALIGIWSWHRVVTRVRGLGRISHLLQVLVKQEKNIASLGKIRWLFLHLSANSVKVFLT